MPMITLDCILISIRTIKSFGYEKTENDKSNIMNIPDVDRKLHVHIQHGHIKKEYDKIDHHINAQACNDPEMGCIEKIPLIIF
jgi:hypothetical protein